MLELHDETNTYSPNLLLATDDCSLPSSLSPLILHNSLTNCGCLFFIQYLPENTIKSCWFLVQINHIETELLNMDSKSTGDYHLRLYQDIQTIMIFVTKQFNGGLCGTNTKMIRIMFLPMVLVCCLDQNANRILINISFEQIPFL